MSLRTTRLRRCAARIVTVATSAPRHIALILALVSLSACGTHAPGAGRNAGDYVGGSVAIECAPFARALSGIRLSGAAADWWRQADGDYHRGSTPSIGSVLVLRRSARVPNGHVAVVTRVLGSRQVLVAQANWVRHRVTADQPVIDVSAANDWSLVRIWWPPAGGMGVAEYPAYGFIRTGHPRTHEQLVAATPQAVRLAVAD
jgi:hypothetical protein